MALENVILGPDVFDPDFVLVFNHSVPNRPAEAPYVILEAEDVSALSWRDRQYLQRPDVAGMLKCHHPRDLGRLNGPTGGNAIHGYDIYLDAPPEHRPTTAGCCYMPEPRLTKAELARIGTGFCSVVGPWFDIHRKPIDWSAPRPTDVCFAGTVNYECGNWYAGWHRNQWLHVARQLPCVTELHASRKFTMQRDFSAFLRQSKIALSPWGIGEYCHRDVEAILSGCVVVKPDSRYVKTWPDIFAHIPTIVPAAIDGSDLFQVVGRILDTWPHWEARRQEADNWLRLQWETVGPLAAHMATQFNAMSKHRQCS